MKKLSIEQLQDIGLEVKSDMFPNNSEATETQEALTNAILSVITRFMEKYQERVDE